MSDSRSPPANDAQSPPARNWRRVALVVGIAAVLVLGVLAAGLWLYGDYLYRSSYESSYTYDVVLNTNESLSNVTLLLPLPVEAGKPDLGAAMVEHGNAEDDPFTYAVVETASGPMLQVTAETVTVTPRYYEFVEEDGQGRRVEISREEYDPTNPNMVRDGNAGTLLTVDVDAAESVRSDDPWGVEPLLSPRGDRRPADCGFPVGDWLRCFAYDTRVYAVYDTNETTRVDVVTRVEGRNAWWVFGWNYDTYTDGVDVDLTGPQDGWSNVTGTVEVDTERRRPPG